MGSKDVRAKIFPGDLSTGRLFDRVPPFRIKPHAPRKPVRDGLLLNGRPIEDPAQALRELRLAPDHADRPFEGLDVGRIGNIRFIHEHQLYKPACDYVNKPPRMTADKGACIVLTMALPKPKAMDQVAKRRPRKTPMQHGTDGRTANDRFREAYRAWGGNQMDLVRACNQLVGKAADAEPPYLSQQIIDQLLRDKTDAARSIFLDVAAEVFGVRAVWLRTGAGEKADDRQVLERLTAILRARESHPLGRS